MTGSGWIRTGEAAGLLGLSRQALHKRVAELAALGVARRCGKLWEFDGARLVDVYRGAVSPVAATEDGEALPALTASKARREAALAALAELELEQKRGELVAVADVSRDWFKAGRTVRDRILNVPDRLAPELAALTTAEAVHRLLSRELRDALTELANQEDLDEVA